MTTSIQWKLEHAKGGDPSEWPKDLRAFACGVGGA